MLVLLELREKLQWLLVILCEKLSKMEISSLVKKEIYIYIYLKKSAADQFLPHQGNIPGLQLSCGSARTLLLPEH